jgi:hypothetical protein
MTINFGTDIWVLTVDGTHHWIEEPQHPGAWSQNVQSTSPTSMEKQPGVKYELGISLADGQLLACVDERAFQKVGLNDINISTTKGLKAKLWATGKMVIDDGGYSGHPYQVSMPNSPESKQCRKSKSHT